LLGLGRFAEAVEQFKAIDSHIKVKICYKKLCAVQQVSYEIREGQADYFSSKGLIDTAVDSYLEALSLTNDPQVHTRIDKKIAATLSSAAAKAGDYTTKARDIENTKIIYAVNKVVYDNPLLNGSYHSKYSPSEFNRLLNLTDFMIKNGLGSLVGDLLNGQDGESMYCSGVTSDMINNL